VRTVVALRALVACLVLLASGTWAYGEVRVQAKHAKSPLTLEVQPTRSGVWTPVGTVDEYVLNPMGDVVGDGFPGHRVEGDRLWTAWTSPSHGGLMVQSGSKAGWSGPSRVLDPQAVGVPVLLRIEGQPAVMWRSGIAGAEVRVALAAEPGEESTSTVVVSRDRLLTWREAGDTIQLISVGEHSRLLIDSVVFRVVLPDQPIIIERSSWELGRLSELPGDPANVDLASVRLQEVQVAETTTVGMLTWWAARGELRFVEIDEDGPVLPVETLTHAGRADRPNSLLQRARRIVSERHE
jgi:hypothetical protein